MRLDKYLKVSRLIRRRTVAADACDAGRVQVNGVPRKAAYEVKPEDIVEISFGESFVKVRVLSVEENVRKDDAKDMYAYV